MAKRVKARLPAPEAPGGDAIGAIKSISVATWLGQSPPRDAMRWLVDCLTEIIDDRNHYARRAFGISARGVASNDGLAMDYLLYVGLARRYGHTLDSAVSEAALAFNKSEATVRKAVRGMTTHVTNGPGSGWDNGLMERILLKNGRKLPLPPIARRRITPAKK